MNRRALLKLAALTFTVTASTGWIPVGATIFDTSSMCLWIFTGCTWEKAASS